MTPPFDEAYWKHNYAEPETMDGIGNARTHAQYVKNYFGLEYVDVSSIVDLGFGYGHLFKEMLKTFKPYKALGIEPSPVAFKKVSPSWLKPTPSTKLKLKKISLLEWCQTPSKEVYDLALCTSVFQYIPTEELKIIVPILSRRVKFLYLTVPTNLEAKRQKMDQDFVDPYSIKRTRAFYQKLLKPHFTVISSRILESKHHFTEETTPFTDLLYRN